MKGKSRLSKFYDLSIPERHRVAAKVLGIDEKVLQEAFVEGGLDVDTADKIIENVIGTYALPFALGLNLQMNNKDYLVPMTVEEPSVVAAVSNAAKMIREGGGFQAQADEPIMIGQVQITDVADPRYAREEILKHKQELVDLGNQAIPDLLMVQGGVRDLLIRDLGQGMLVVHMLVDCRDAMGANTVNTVCEKVAGRIAALAQGQVGLRILSNLCDHRLVTVTSRAPIHALGLAGYSGQDVCEGVVKASIFAERDPYRAATHNKGVMNGIDAVTIATGNDWRAVEAGVHAFAARNGTYEPICTWHVDDQGMLTGRLQIPLALGTVGGSSRSHRAAKLALRILDVNSARELAMVVASVGMASNLAALRALATEGIQRGHMMLHARSVAITAGVSPDLVETVATRIRDQGQITVEAARKVLQQLKG